MKIDSALRLEYLDRFVSLLSIQRIPVVVKGNVALRALLRGVGMSEYCRETRDVDLAFRANKPVSTEILAEVMQKIVPNLGNNFSFKVVRELSTTSTARFRIFCGDTAFFDIDFGVLKNGYLGNGAYISLQNVNFVGYNLLDILVDKLSVVSSRTVYRRGKDVYDLWVLTGLFAFNYADILKHLQNTGRNIGDFSAFIQPEGLAQLEHMWGKLTLGESTAKPAFGSIVMGLGSFSQPFLVQAPQGLKWNNAGRSWGLE